MKDARIKKRRDLRRQARSDRGISSLFEVYHPDHKEPRRFYDREEWDHYYNTKHNWEISLGGHWAALYGSPPSDYRRMFNRLLRARQKATLRQAVLNDALEDFSVPPLIHNLGWYYW